LAAELLSSFSPYLESLALLPSGGGRFEVKVDEDLIFSKKSLGRHAQPGEVVRLLQDKTGFAPEPRE
jgi:selenoprotein W-related protein